MTTFSEIQINGTPIDWTYWSDKKLSPKESAYLANRIDPLNIENISVPKDIQNNINRLERDLKDKPNLTLDELCLFLGEDAPLRMVEVSKSHLTNQRQEFINAQDSENISTEDQLRKIVDDEHQIKSKRQLAAIELIINAKGWLNSGIPTGDKETIKILCNESHPNLFDHDTSFDNAWKVRDKTRLRMSDHASFSFRGKQ